MKKQISIYFALIIILMASLACNIGGAAPTTEGDQTNPAATTDPSQQAVGSDGAAGPETIDLTNPALYIIPGAQAFIYKSSIKYTGVDTTGAAKEVSETGLVEAQTQPQITQHFLSSSGGDGAAAGSSDAGSLNVSSVDTTIIGDQMYIVAQASVGGGTPELRCNTTLVSSMQGPGMLESALKSIVKFQEGLTGQASRVESGIEVNGFVTDKYELPSENSDGSAFVYVARDGGFITLFEAQGRDKIALSGFDPNQFTDIAIAYNFIPAEDGSLDIAIPAECNK